MQMYNMQVFRNTSKFADNRRSQILHDEVDDELPGVVDELVAREAHIRILEAVALR